MSSMKMIRGTLRQTLMASACALALVAPSTAQQHEHAAPPGATGNYGQVHFPIACSPKAQQNFVDAVAMLHSFHFPATGKAFTAITEAEPDCAMAWWGLAISQRLNPLVPPFAPKALGRGWQAIEHARCPAAHRTRARLDRGDGQLFPGQRARGPAHAHAGL